MAITFLFPDGKRKAVTFSYDDGVTFDRQLIDIFNRHHLKGTFNLNSGLIPNNTGKIQAADIPAVYAGHEVACHAYTHPFLERLAPGECMREVWQDRQRLEEITGTPVIGMAYPYGTYNSQVIDILRSAGIVYSRTTAATMNFALPDNYLAWHPSCHHRNMLELGPRFLDAKYAYSVLYVWGHSYEFDRNNNWEDMEKFADLICDKPDIWYATNIEIYRYDQAVKALVTSTDGKMLYNPSAVTVWFSYNNTVQTIAPGATWKA